MIVRNSIVICSFVIISLQAVVVTVENKYPKRLFVYPEKKSKNLVEIDPQQTISMEVNHLNGVSGYIRYRNPKEEFSMIIDQENMKITIVPSNQHG